MRYLLTQQVRKAVSKSKVKVYPGNTDFIRLATKLKIKKQEIKMYSGEHLITEYYLFSLQDYELLCNQYKQWLEKKREKFNALDPLLRLVQLLKYIYNRNSRAKEVEKYSAKLNAYDDKNLFLNMALGLAKQIQYPFFRYGYQEDPSNSLHHYIYYFEIESLGQISFHSEQLFYDVPIFEGKWSGIINAYFPFEIRKIKHLITNLNN